MYVKLQQPSSFLRKNGPIKRMPDGAVVYASRLGRRCAPRSAHTRIRRRASTAYTPSTQWHAALSRRLFQIAATCLPVRREKLQVPLNWNLAGCIGSLINKREWCARHKRSKQVRLGLERCEARHCYIRHITHKLASKFSRTEAEVLLAITLLVFPDEFIGGSFAPECHEAHTCSNLFGCAFRISRLDRCPVEMPTVVLGIIAVVPVSRN